MRGMTFACLCLAFAAALAGAAPTSADGPLPESTPGSLVTVRTAGGGMFRGTLFAIQPDRVELAGPEGVITPIARSSIIAMEQVRPDQDRAEYFLDSASNRLILMPTAYGMDPGEFHVAAQEIILITASYGITDRMSAWAAVSFPGAVANLRWSSHAAGPFAVSAGALAGLVWTDPAGLVMPYAIASFGHENRNITAGLGVPFAWWSGAAIQPVGIAATLAGKIIVSPSSSVVTENWVVFPSEGWSDGQVEATVMPAAVFRIAGERFSWDIGAVVPLFVNRAGRAIVEGLLDSTVIPIPILSVTYRID